MAGGGRGDFDVGKDGRRRGRSRQRGGNFVRGRGEEERVALNGSY